MAKVGLSRLTILGLLCSGAVVFFLIKHVDLAEVRTAFSGLSPAQLWPALGLVALSALVRPWRWRVLFPPLDRPHYRACFSVLYLGNMANNILPARSGDLIRCFVLAESLRSRSRSTALATLFLERILDGLALLALLLASLQYLTPPWWVGRLSLFGVALFGVPLMLLVAMYHRAPLVARWVRSAFRLLGRRQLAERMVARCLRFADGLHAVSSLSQLLVPALLTLVIWVSESMMVYSVFWALGIRLPWLAGAAILAMVSLSAMIPSAPAAVGTFELAVVAGLSLFAVDRGTALAAAVTLHVWCILTTIVAGVVGLLCAGFGFDVLWRQLRLSATSAPNKSPAPQ